jgi:menaquinone-dependent protoporphyrinogen oxidase
MQVLVTVASRHGSTREIGEVVAEVLRNSGFDVDVTDPDEVEDLDRYDAVVLGSSVYLGRWAASARALVDRLTMRPHVMVWLFSSGPVGNPPTPVGDPEEVLELIARLGARGHRTFPGRLDPHTLGLAERAAVAVVRAQSGDFRAWQQIEDWARAIAADLHGEEVRRVDLAR